MRFPHLVNQVFFSPLMITHGGFLSVATLLLNRMGSEPRADIDVSDFANQRPAMEIDSNGVAVINLLGPVAPGLAPIQKSCGATDSREVRDEIAAAHGSARSILLVIDSPGGACLGTPELANAVADSRLPVTVFTEGLCCSAAYYVAAGASRIFASQSAEVGSIGAYVPWVDWLGQAEQSGVMPNPVVNAEGTFKALGFWPTLSDTHRAHLQAQVDQTFSEFRAHVLRFRDVPADAMRGQTLHGPQAISAGLTDEIGDYQTAYNHALRTRV